VLTGFCVGQATFGRAREDRGGPQRCNYRRVLNFSRLSHGGADDVKNLSADRFIVPVNESAGGRLMAAAAKVGGNLVAFDVAATAKANLEAS
jgi:hypothetical protein